MDALSPRTLPHLHRHQNDLRWRGEGAPGEESRHSPRAKAVSRVVPFRWTQVLHDLADRVLTRPTTWGRRRTGFLRRATRLDTAGAGVADGRDDRLDFRSRFHTGHPGRDAES